MSQLLTGGTAPQIPGGFAEQAALGNMAPPPEEETPRDPLGALQAVIEEFPALHVALTDPQDVHDAVKAMNILTGIQRRLMGATGSAG